MRPLRSLAAISLSAVAVLGSCLPAQAVTPANVPAAARQSPLPGSLGRQLNAAPEGSSGRASDAYEFSVSFCGVYELVGAVDKSTDDVRATLYAKIPMVGRVQLSQLSGNLDTGVTQAVDTPIAKGTFSLWVDADRKVWADPAIDLKFVGKTECKAPILTLPWTLNNGVA
ncbi:MULTISPECIES: hypothetical protein [unclassified Streptomyces]|uniref:hypothetical protein n=1 Tax=unclassified Streptomyces TaxID=2593676 RepID=UPI002E0FF2DF|nr:hypothetical protein OG466_40685 [Streptomyces sp. NBC_01240]